MSTSPTESVIVSRLNPDPKAIEQAAALIRTGGLVAFPTETVYGLGANGLDPMAVARIYSAKGRPTRNPIILHVGSFADALPLVTTWTPAARLLVERFWPGPLTIVLPRSSLVPDIVAAGGPTVAIRRPAHPVALALVRTAGVPIAAPSANRSGELSPTCAEHVLRGLDGRINLLLDGGPTSAGIESTVVDLSGPAPRLVRPGPISLAQLESLIGPFAATTPISPESPLPSPGMLDRHYAPRTPMEGFTQFPLMADRSIDLWRSGQNIGMVFFGNQAHDSERIVRIAMLPDPAIYAANLYRVLHELDARGLDRILIQLPPDTDDWLAIHDRLKRAVCRTD